MDEVDKDYLLSDDEEFFTAATREQLYEPAMLVTYSTNQPNLMHQCRVTRRRFTTGSSNELGILFLNFVLNTHDSYGTKSQ